MKDRFPVALAAAALFALAMGSGSVLAACKDCGTVVDVKTVKKEGEASGAGAVVGGVLGGVLGHQVGSGRGNTAATVVGAGAGAYAGHQVEKNQKSTTTYQVGDKIRIVDTKLVRQESRHSFSCSQPRRSPRPSCCYSPSPRCASGAARASPCSPCARSAGAAAR